MPARTPLASELLVPQHSDAGHLNGGAARHEHVHVQVADQRGRLNRQLLAAHLGAPQGRRHPERPPRSTGGVVQRPISRSLSMTPLVEAAEWFDRQRVMRTRMFDAADDLLLTERKEGS